MYSATDSEDIPAALGDAACAKILRIKVGAQVMLMKNLDLSKNLSNGSRGVIQAFRNGMVDICGVSGTGFIMMRKE